MSLSIAPAIDRLENSTEIEPVSYIEATGKLLASDDPHELAVGIIAATGRRPHEVIARAKFSPVEGKSYHVMFQGQGKKRGETPVFEIATLYPADYVIKALAKLRREPGTKALLKEVAAEFPKSVTRQNVEIDKRRNGSLNQVVRARFGDKGQDNPVLKFRHGEKQDNCKALSGLAIAQPTNQASVSQPATQAPTKQPDVTDWESKSNAEVWGSKVKGASEEKVRRSFNAIALYTTQ